MSSCVLLRGATALKSVAGVLLVAIAITAVAIGGLREAKQSTQAAIPAALAAPESSPAIATVYYFHGDTRCETCLTIERQAGELVRSAFAADIAAGRLQYRAVNYDTPDNRHFREEYDLSFGSVVVTDGSRWENLSDVWTLVHDGRAAFDGYLIARIQPYIKAGL